MAEETHRSSDEAALPGRRWLQLAALWRGRLAHGSVAPPGLATLQFRQRAARAAAPLADIRRRVREATGRAPLPQPRPPAATAALEAASRAARPVELDLPSQRQLEDFLRMRLPRIVLHTSADADRAVSRVGADALSAGSAIHFRRDAPRSRSREGMGLLAHEATHIAWHLGARPLAGSAHATASEETVALSNESRFLAGRPAVPMRSPPASAPQRTSVASPAGAPPAPPAGALAFARAAMAGREIGDPTDAAPAAGGGQLAPAAVQALKADLYRMLLDRLRSEFERGA